ncbi:MAG: amidohydrolase family protein [Endomicrobium sp.]|jgi:predicted TIM-barrel fold metal-dependent hydrolase|nr:amidohydrolase family protein [Endomicrobium sp.]
MDIIDAHTHVWPEKIVFKAKSYLENVINRQIVILPTVNNLLRYMDINGVSKSIVSSVASRPDQVISINNWLFSLKYERIIVFAAIHPFFSNFKEELKRIKDSCFGVKLQPDFQNFYVNDEKAFPFYEELEKLQLPILLHCGVSSCGDIKSSPDKVEKIIVKFPGIKIIGAHMGGYLMWKESLEKLCGKSLYFDTSDSVRFMKKELLNKFFNQHGFDKIIYGSDFPIGSSKEDINFIQTLSISEENKQKIFSKNIKKMLNIN